MKNEDLKVLIIKLVKTFPNKVQPVFFKIIIETRFLIFKIKFWHTKKNIPNPIKIFWISPNSITECLSPLVRKRYFSSERIRGKIIGGNWDKTTCEFEKTMDIYDAFRKRVNEKTEWRDTEYYKRILKEVKSGNFLYGIRNKIDLDERCKYLDSLYVNIKNSGYRLNRNNYHSNITFNEIDVNIGRNGEYIIRDGVHRLSIAKIIGIKYVPVTVFVRHKKWQEFRNFLLTHDQHQGVLISQPLIHPDLLDIQHTIENKTLWKKIPKK